MLKFFVICLLAVSCKGAPISNEAQDDEATAQILIKATGNEKNILPDEECQLSNLKVTFELYTRERPSKYELNLDNFNSTKFSSYNIKQYTKIYVHDWLQNTSNSLARDMAAAYLRDNDKAVNVILVNYGSVSCCRFKVFREMKPEIAKEVARLMKQLVLFGSLPGKIHIIGLGMGSQIAGLAAAELHPMKVGRLTALDPTYIGFSEANPQLKNQVAEYLDIIHTAQRKFQSVKYLGNIRFFPNEGTSQPSAGGLNAAVGGAISHLMSSHYWLESILKHAGFESKQCDSYLNYNLGKCSQNPTAYMGEHVDKKQTGDFYLKTRSVPPFALVVLNTPNVVYNIPAVEDVLQVNAPQVLTKEKVALTAQRFQQYKLKLQQEEQQQGQKNQQKYQQILKQTQEDLEQRKISRRDQQGQQQQQQNEQ